MRLTIPHNFDFGTEQSRVGDELARPESWTPSATAAARSGCQSGGKTGRRRRPAGTCRPGDGHRLARGPPRSARLFSYGVGTGLLELRLSQLAPGLRLTCTDFAPKTVERPQGLFPEAEVRLHDLREGRAARGRPPAVAPRRHRVPDPGARRLLARFHEPVLLVPAHLLGPRLLVHELLLRMRRRRTSRAGWVRTNPRCGRSGGRLIPSGPDRGRRSGIPSRAAPRTMTESRRVALCFGTYPPERNGGSDFVARLGRALAAAGREVHVLTSAGEGPDRDGAVHVHRVMHDWALAAGGDARTRPSAMRARRCCTCSFRTPSCRGATGSRRRSA